MIPPGTSLLCGRPGLGRGKFSPCRYDHLVCNGTKGTVEDISNEGLEEPVTVYNFEVKDFHTYFVGESGVLVHNTCTNDTNISPQMEEKILHGERKDPAKNQLIGGHSPDINNANPNYAVEVLSTNTDGTKSVKFVTQYSDGNLSKFKSSTLFPDDWSNDSIIESIKTVGSTNPLGVRTTDGATFT